MSKPVIKYEIAFKNAEIDGSKNFAGVDVNIGIYDMSFLIADDAETTVIPLQAAGDPLHLYSIDNSEDPFTPIRPMGATIKFLSDDTWNLSFPFIDQPPIDLQLGDQRWYVEITINSLIVFKGWLVMDDCSEAFMPTPNIVTLTAVDGLGLLKNIPLSLIVTNPAGYFRIADYLAGALLKTGLSLGLNVMFNIRELNNPSSHLFDASWLWAKTFEDKIGTFKNAYDVIAYILGEEAYLCQRAGEWWILRVDEIESTLHYRTRFNSDGSLDTVFPGVANFVMVIEKDFAEMRFSQEGTEVAPQSEHSRVKETYRLEPPLELVCNIDYTRGDFIADLPTESEDGITYDVKSYEIDCVNNTHSPYIPGQTGPSPTAQAYIKRLLFNGNEKQRYFVLPTVSSGADFVEFGTMPISFKDKINVHIDFRWPDDLGGTGTVNLNSIMFVTLKGDDDTNWHLIEDGTWVSSGSGGTWSPLNGIGLSWLRQDVNETEWRTIGADSKAAPVSGKIRIAVISIGNVAGTDDDHDMYYSNLSIEYLALIDGSYKPVTSIYDKVSRPLNLKSIREKEVFMSDGIRKLFKGGLHRYNGTDYVLTNEFFNWTSAQTTTPDPSLVHPYLHIQTFDVWNQFRNKMRVFHAVCQGLQTHLTDNYGDIAMPSPIHRFVLNDATYHTTDRYFILLTFDFDCFLCEWKGTLRECFNTVKGKRYDDTEEVKYE